MIRRIERYLRQEENFSLLNVNQATRILKSFSYAAHSNLMRIPLLEMLVRKIHQNIDTLRENDVIAILKAYQYLSTDVKFSSKLIQDLNATVVSTALENKNEVSVGFLVNYLHNFFLINQRNQVASRDLSKEQRESLVGLLEEKLKTSDQHTKGVSSVMTLGLSRILIRNPKQEVIRETLASTLRTQARKLNFEELHSALYALRSAYNSDKTVKDAGLQAK